MPLKPKKKQEEDSIDEENLNLLREPYIRISEYIKQLNDELKLTYEKYNEFKLNILYEHVNTTESQLTELKDYETKIEDLNKSKTKYILKNNKKTEDTLEVIKTLKLNISERQHEYNISEDIEETKTIYTETNSLKTELFEIFRKNISIIDVESVVGDTVNKYSTIYIDYSPIKRNQKKIKTEKVVETKPVEFNILE